MIIFALFYEIVASDEKYVNELDILKHLDSKQSSIKKIGPFDGNVKWTGRYTDLI
jgi:hypothetical protein